jgi:L-fuconolactonase
VNAVDEAIDNLLPARITDAHVHLWDLGRLHMPWIGPPLNRNFLLSDYQQASAGLNVTRAVYVEVGSGAAQRQEEAELIIELCRAGDNPLAGVVMGGDVAYGHFMRYLSSPQASKWVKGVRQGVPEMRELSAGSAFVRGVRKLGELGVIFELNTELAKSIALVELCPQTHFVLDHCGGATFEILADPAKRKAWNGGIARIAEHENVLCKVSGVGSTAPGGQWNAAQLEGAMARLLHEFGAERLMYGGDWPICTLGGTLKRWAVTVAWLLRERTAEEREAIFFDNAVRWYGLEQALAKREG